jgi:taurine transport system permease protein
VAIPVGIAMGMSRFWRGIFDPPIELYRPLPPLAYLPLIIIWFGIDELPKVLLIFLSCFAPLAMAARSGMRSASQEQMNAAYSMGASYTQLIRHVVLPAALPEILVGMRVAIGFGKARCKPCLGSVQERSCDRSVQVDQDSGYASRLRQR